MLYVASFLVAMLLAVLLIPLLSKVAIPLGLVDVPNERKVHRTQIPRVGGVAIGVGSLLPLLVWSELDTEMQAYIIGAMFILIFGIWDDRKELNYKLKFLGQFIAVGIFVFWGDVYIQWLPFLGLSEAPLWLSLSLTIFALLGITNAVNLVDGLDGLAGGTSLLSLGAIGLIAFLAGDVELVLMTLAICGGIFGFLRYNTHPATIFMGDTGSQFLGYSIGVAAVLLTQQANTALSPILPLIILGLPILDTLTVMARRLMEGRSPFSPDKNHFHHRLMDLGFKHYEAVIAIYIVQITLILIGFSMKYQNDILLLFIFAVFCFGFNGLFRYAEKSNWCYQGAWFGGSLRPLLKSDSISQMKQLSLSMFQPFVLFTLPLYLFVCVWQAREFDGMVTIYGAMLVLSFALMFRPISKQDNFFSRLVWYAACGLGVYCSVLTGVFDYFVVKVYLAVLALMILVSFQFESKEVFSINPLDIIVLVSAVVMFYLSDVSAAFGDLGAQITHAIIFLYAVELMLNGKKSHRSMARLALSTIFLVSGAFAII